jgi:N-acetylglucosaminyl-diphospho-decaprenol L-rhamnosyltransferase
MPAISVIIINWHSKDYLRECLGSIRRMESEAALEIIVADNNSGDGLAQMLATEFPEVRLVQASENLGFAKANNLGASEAHGEFLLFLNPDTRLQNAAITLLSQELRAKQDVWVVGPKLLNTDGSVQTSCIQAFPTIVNQLVDSDWLRARLPRSRLWGVQPLVDSATQPCPVDMVSGACLMVHRDAFERVGRFSEDYFMYFEDMDLCRKIRQQGGGLWFVPAAQVTHHGGGSSRRNVSGFAAVNSARALDVYFRKWHGGAYAGLYRILLSVAASLRLGFLSLSMLGLCCFGPSGDVKSSISKWKVLLRWSVGLSGSASR